MTYTAQDSGANLSKLDAISVFLNFLYRDDCQQLFLRGEKQKKKKTLLMSERERERDLVRAFRLEAPTTMLLTKLVAVKSISALGTSMSWRITSFASI
jgi:hypothetical protein